MKRRIWPYLRPAPSALVAREWQLLVEDVQQDLPSVLPYWDYRTDLSLRRTVELDVVEVLELTGLPSDAQVGLAVIWTASGSGLREAAARIPLASTARGPVEIAVELPGARLGGTLVLRTYMVLLDPGSGADALAPRRPGSILWSDEHRVRLQGDAPQFPIAVIDFANTAMPEAAAWHLDVGTQLEAATMGALLLYINERNKTVVRAFQNAATPKTADRLILSAVFADVARVMIEAGLHNPDLTDDASFDDDTLGQTLQNLIRSLFPGRSIADLRALREHSPHLLATQIQAAAGIFRDM